MVSLIVLLAGVPALSCSVPEVLSVTPLVDDVRQYAVSEFAIRANAKFDNPYDARQVRLDAEFETPSGRVYRIPGFWWEGYEFGRGDWPVATGEAGWRVRFCPLEAGKHRMRVLLTDQRGRAESPWLSFEVRPGRRRGPIKAKGLYLRFGSGRPFVPLGLNAFTWIRKKRRFEGLRKLTMSLAEAGGNFIRLRADSTFWSFEGPPRTEWGFRGLGWYHQPTCFEIDDFFQQCEKLGLYAMLCLYNAHMINNTRGDWLKWSPFAKRWGGPCERPEEFWTNVEAKQAVRNKLRYAVARWGAYPSLAVWEFFNEVFVTESNAEHVVAWHREMARYLRSIDPYAKPITTSGFGAKLGLVFALPELDMSQSHIYELHDLGALCIWPDGRPRFGKPHLIGEFGPKALQRQSNWAKKETFDLEGVNLHNGLWSSLAAGSCGGGVNWWYDWVDLHNLYYHFASVSRFLKETRFAATDPEPLAVERPQWRDPNLTGDDGRWTLVVASPCPSTLSPPWLPLWKEVSVGPRTVMFLTSSAWRRRRSSRILVRPDGRIEPLAEVGCYLFCRPKLKNPPTFVTQSRWPWQFVVHVARVVGRHPLSLTIRLDGAVVRKVLFPVGPEAGKDRKYVEQHEQWVCNYSQDVAISVPAGRHEINVEASGGDRIVVWFEFRDYLSCGKFVPIRVAGVRFGDDAFKPAEQLVLRTAWH